MPELPEVEAARRAIEEHCLGKKIKSSIVADDSKVIDGVSPADFQASLLGKTIVAAHRKGKNMWIELESPPFPSFQFGMAGAIYIKGVAVTKYKRYMSEHIASLHRRGATDLAVVLEICTAQISGTINHLDPREDVLRMIMSAVNDTDEWPSKYSKLFIELDDGLELSFTDKRRFAKVRLLKDPASVPPISELGPDALLEPMTTVEFVESLSKRKNTIKALLLDQSFIAGIGNWIADEVLYQARIHPQQIASNLSKECCESLLKSIKEVIEKAVEVGADSSQYPNNWIFHSREKKPGKAFVDGEEIEFITAGGRTTAYVPELQKLTGTQSVKASHKPRKQSSDGHVEEEPESEEDEKIKLKKGKKKTKGEAKPSSAKRKAKSKDSDDDDDNDDDDDDEDEVLEKKMAKVTNNKQSKEMKSSKKLKTSQKSTKLKKKLK